MCQVLEAELQAQESLYQGVLARGQDLLSKQSQVNQRAVQKWIRTLKKQWSHLTDEAMERRNRLQAAAAVKQVDKETQTGKEKVTNQEERQRKQTKEEHKKNKQFL